MSDSRQQSYYEIALTNRQVVMVFIVLLVCVLAAFLGGVWMGRGETALVATVEPQSISSGVSAGDQPLEPVGFFEQEAEAEPGAGSSGAADSAESMPVESESVDPPQPVIIEELRRAPEPEAPGATTEQVTSPAVESEAPQRSEGPVSAISAAEVSGPAAGGELVVQVFSSTDEAQARRVLERVKSGGYDASLSPIDSQGRRMYRVRVGPYSDRAEAQTVADRIRRTYKLDTWITR